MLWLLGNRVERWRSWHWGTLKVLAIYHLSPGEGCRSPAWISSSACSPIGRAGSGRLTDGGSSLGEQSSQHPESSLCRFWDSTVVLEPQPGRVPAAAHCPTAASFSSAALLSPYQHPTHCSGCTGKRGHHRGCRLGGGCQVSCHTIEPTGPSQSPGQTCPPW